MLLDSHYLKSQIFVQKINFEKKKNQHFHEFVTQNFFDNFSREIKVVNNSKLNFWTKNEDFEQCELAKSLQK